MAAKTLNEVGLWRGACRLVQNPPLLRGSMDWLDGIEDQNRPGDPVLYEEIPQHVLELIHRALQWPLWDRLNLVGGVLAVTFGGWLPEDVASMTREQKTLVEIIERTGAQFEAAGINEHRWIGTYLAMIAAMLFQSIAVQQNEAVREATA